MIYISQLWINNPSDTTLKCDKIYIRKLVYEYNLIIML